LQQAGLDEELSGVLLESIDETVTALLSRKVADSLYVYVEKVHSIPRNEVPHRLDLLVPVLERIFGAGGSRTICKAIARNLYTKLDVEFFDLPSRTFLEFVEGAKIKLRERNQGAD
jgi:hypothetical protein